jgi:endonuclease V-like protein UPF0215 family
MIKKEIRVLGIACTPPRRRSMIPTQVVGVVYRGSRWLEGVMRTTFPSDVVDLTPRTARMVASSPHFPQLRVIALDELITKSGNYFDIEALSRKTRLPVIAVLPKKISTRRLSNMKPRIPRRRRRALAQSAYAKWNTGSRVFFVYSAGLGLLDLDEILEVCASKEGIPEAARVARIIASSLGQLRFRRAR